MKWTSEEDKVLLSNYPSKTIKELSIILNNRSKSSITARLKILGIYVNKKNKKRELPSYLDLNNLFEARGYKLISPETEYKNLTTKLKYICKKHEEKGILQIDTSHFLDGKGCRYCGIEKSSSFPKGKYSEADDEQFCKRKNIKYIETKSINGKPYIYFLCPKHKMLGIQNIQRSNLMRESSKGCKYCSSKSLPNWYIKAHIETMFPLKVESDFEGMNKPLKCFCTIHEEHFSNLAKYIYYKGRGCALCHSDFMSDSQKKSEVEVEKDIHTANPDIELVSYKEYKNCESKIHVRCKKCTKVWQSTLSSIKANKVTCPFCSKIISKGEAYIRNYLTNWEIPFQVQYSFSDCRGDKNPLPFDFAIMKNEKIFCLIEYQGIQHYQPIKYFGGENSFKKRTRYDKIKEKYCEENNIPFLSIPYTEQNIKSKIKSFLIKYNY